MSWEKEIEELRDRQALARELGGPERVKRHKDGGKLTVRERIDQLLDPGSFREIGSVAGKASYDEAGNIAGFMPANLVMGRGHDRRPAGRRDERRLHGPRRLLRRRLEGQAHARRNDGARPAPADRAAGRRHRRRRLGQQHRARRPRQVPGAPRLGRARART